MSTLPYDQGRVTGSRFTLLPEIRTKPQVKYMKQEFLRHYTTDKKCQ